MSVVCFVNESSSYCLSTHICRTCSSSCGCRVLTVKSANDKTGKLHSFEVATKETTFYMHAGSEQEKDDWIGAIGRAIVRFSTSYAKKDVETHEDSDSDVSSDSD